MRGRDCQVFW